MKLTSILTLTALLTCLHVPAIGSDSSAVARLCQTVKDRNKMIVDKGQTEVIWSDGAMFEVNSKFPAALQELISASKEHRDLKPAIARLTAGPDWKDATVSRSSGGDPHRTVKSSDGTVSVKASSAYLDYVKERYPNARVRIKGEFQPIVFQVGDTVRAAVMPIRSATPATPADERKSKE
jgi:hypothetical protein